MRSVFGCHRDGRARVRTSIVLLAGLSTLPGCWNAKAPETAGPNLLLITVESLRADRLGFMGYAAAESSNLDALAARAAAFTEALTPSPDAIPALASLHTGQYPATHGLRRTGAQALPQEAATLAETLRSSGYRTGACTATLALHPKFSLDQGFDVYTSAFQEMPRPSQSPEAGIQAAKSADCGLEFLETARRLRFFLWVNFYDPHFPYSPPEPFASRHASNPYDGEVAYLDREVGRILSKLKEYELEGKTIVVFAGSHGEGLGSHGEDYSGTTLQRATTRVPLLIAAPSALSGRLGAGSRVATPVSLVDVAPTVLDLMGAPGLPSADGLSLARSEPPARPIYIETQMPAALFGWRPLTGVVSGPWKCVAGNRSELYDQASDPEETRESSALHRNVVEEMARLIEGYVSRRPVDPVLDQSSVEAIRGAGFDPAAKPREPADPRDMVAVANDALKGDRSLRSGMTQAASFLFEGVLARDPDNYLGLLDMSSILASRRDDAGALRLLERARDLYPAAAEPYHQMGHILLGRPAAGGAATAHQLFRIAARLDPMNEEALYDVACGHAVEGNGQAALDALQRAVDAGFRDFRHMARDTDLDGIRTDPRFDVITAGMARRPAAPATEGGQSR